MDVLANNGVLYEGLQILGHGATLAGIILGSIAVMIIDGKLVKAAAFAAVGGALTFFGLIHSEAIGVMKMPAVAAAYMVVAIFLYACRSEEHTSELQSLMRISYAVFCLNKKKK